MAAVPTHEVADAGTSRVAAVVSKHERTLLRVARQASLCDDDAYDAYQRAVEIFLRRVDTVDPATEVAWLRVVVRHEAMAIRRSRSETVAGEELEIDEFVPGAGRDVEEVPVRPRIPPHPIERDAVTKTVLVAQTRPR